MCNFFILTPLNQNTNSAEDQIRNQFLYMLATKASRKQLLMEIIIDVYDYYDLKCFVNDNKNNNVGYFLIKRLRILKRN